MIIGGLGGGGGAGGREGAEPILFAAQDRNSYHDSDDSERKAGAGPTVTAEAALALMIKHTATQADSLRGEAWVGCQDLALLSESYG